MFEPTPPYGSRHCILPLTTATGRCRASIWRIQEQTAPSDQKEKVWGGDEVVHYSVPVAAAHHRGVLLQTGCESARRLGGRVELLQFHWHDVSLALLPGGAPPDVTAWR